MSDRIHALKQLFADETAVTSIEYALIASLIAIVCVVTIGLLGTNLSVLFSQVCNEVSTAISGAPAC